MWRRLFNLQCDGFDFDAEVPCRLLRHGYQILEIPVAYNPRSIDEGKKLTPRVGWSVLRAISADTLLEILDAF